MNVKTIYQQLSDALLPEEIDNHESDLYVKKCLRSTAILEEYEFWGNVTTFRHQVTGERWYDVPFAYDPYWERKTGKTVSQ